MNILITSTFLDIPSYETFKLFCDQTLRNVDDDIRLVLLNQPRSLAIFIEAYALDNGYPCDLMPMEVMLKSTDAAIIFKSPTTINPLIEILDEHNIKKKIKLINTDASTT